MFSLPCPTCPSSDFSHGFTAMGWNTSHVDQVMDGRGKVNGPCCPLEPTPSQSGFLGLFITYRRNPKGFMQVTLPWDMQRLFLKCQLFPFPFLSESCGSFTRGG